jgi:hypothetical protein
MRGRTNEYIRRAIQLYKTGMAKSKVAKIISEEYNIEYNDALRRKLSRNIDSNLEKYADEQGIPVENISYYWHKGKSYSIFATNKVSMEEVAKRIVDDVKNYSYDYKFPDPIDYGEEGCLLIINPADLHIGKYASTTETGNSSYNIIEAVDACIECIYQLTSAAAVYPISKIVFVGGNDVLHTDNTRRTTTKGVPQDTDGMWFEAFEAAKSLYIGMVEHLLSLAPVHFVYCPSNHDYMSGYFLADVVSSWFHKVDTFTCDVSPSHRKYINFDTNLIGFTHGDGARTANLPLLMAHEAPDAWSACQHKYIYTHHVHHKVAKDYMSVCVESMRSLSPADSWHHKMGFQHAPRTMEAFVHHPQRGQIARITHALAP